NAPDSSGLQKDYNTSSPSMKPVATTTGTNFGLQTKNSVKMRTSRNLVRDWLFLLASQKANAHIDYN
ncbi:MAG: hypothetical protein JWQ71_2703, partial [Pedosphaera sp.]|nr:hypothetical protein [Pedosphaera sp.]